MICRRLTIDDNIGWLSTARYRKSKQSRQTFKRIYRDGAALKNKRTKDKSENY